MAKISTKNAHLIRRGIRDGKRLVLQSQAGMSYCVKSHDSALEHRAYMHMIDNELNRLAKKGKKMIDDLASIKLKLKANS